MTNDFSLKTNELFADAYHAAALQEADMQALVAVLEPMRQRLKENGDTLATRAALDKVVGGNADSAAEEALLQLRTNFYALQKQIWVAEMNQALQQSPEEAWSLFLDRYATAMYYWRTQLMWWWANAAAGAAPENDKPWFKNKTDEVRRFREQSRLIEHGRWPEAYAFLRELAENQKLTPKLRAQLRTVCGSIQMHYNTLPDARNDLAEAKKLYPDLQYWPVCSADLERVAGNLAASRDILEKHLVNYPDDPEAYIALGRSFLEEKNLDEADRWFEKAIEVDPGNASAYRNRMAVLGKNEELFQKNKEQIAGFRRLADRADPESALSNLLEAGYAYQSGGDSGAAAACFEEARKSDPERVEPIVAAGYLFQEQQQPEQAAECYETILRLAPGAVDGYWNFAALSAEKGQYLEAAGWYEKALPHCPMFTRTLLVKAGEMYMAAGEFEKAKISCLQSLERDPSFDFAINTLHDLSDKLRDKGYAEKTGTEPAIEILRAIRNIKGESYEAGFHNRVGNVYYYFADYQSAVAAYQKAIVADASTAVYHDNLAGALDKLSDTTDPLTTLTEALQAAQAAARLEPGNEGYRHLTARLERKLVSLRHFGVSPDERSANIFSIRVRFREELYPWLVKDDNLVPELLQKIETLREKFRKAYGIALPGVRFSTDWNIVEGANFVIDLDGIPMQQGWLTFTDETAGANFDTLMVLLEQNIQYSLADFIHYDAPEVSAKFIGKSADYASGFFQLIRMLLKQKISVVQTDTIHEIYEAGIRERKTVQAIAEEVRRHPAMLPDLPVNTSPGRALQHLSAEQEEAVLSSVGKSTAGQLLWQIRPDDPAFYAILEYLPKTDFALGTEGHFVTTQYPQVATLLNDLQPGAFFSRGEILNLSETEQAAIPN
ncbi:MAG TPA: tetratricopeptide repeat protein [Saprospiraceae bacterium]|nr:tetratricopeptide repeat protein [Saprospiraceae bacterium]